MSELLANSPIAGAREPIGELGAELKTGEGLGKKLVLSAAPAKRTGLQEAGETRVVIGNEIVVIKTTAAAWTEAEVRERAGEETPEENHAAGAKVYAVPTRKGLLKWLETTVLAKLLPETIEGVKKIIGSALELTKVKKLEGEAGSELKGFGTITGGTVTASTELHSTTEAVLLGIIRGSVVGEPGPKGAKQIFNLAARAFGIEINQTELGEVKKLTIKGAAPNVGQLLWLLSKPSSAANLVLENTPEIESEGGNLELAPAANLTLEPGQSVLLIADGTQKWHNMTPKT